MQNLAKALLNQTWRIGRYRFDFVVTEPIDSPDYAGSMIRGAFGHALRRTACMTKMSDCHGCPLYRTCPYTCLFETPAPEEHALQKFSQVPNPYVIEPPRWGRRLYAKGERFSFSMVLFGQACDQLALIVYAFRRAFTHPVGHGKAQLDGVYFEGQEGWTCVFSPENDRVLPHDPTVHLSRKDDILSVSFLTPLRLQANGRGLRANEITAERLLVGLMRRVALMTEFHQPQARIDFPFSALKTAAMKTTLRAEWQFMDWVRYSGRQKQAMHLGGVIGQATLSGLNPAFALLLELGQWMHIGKNATFGLGKYVLLPAR